METGSREGQILAAASVVMSDPNAYMTPDVSRDFCARLSAALAVGYAEGVRDVLRSQISVREMLTRDFPEAAQPRGFSGGGELLHG
jgi:hypothetical protein